MLSNRRGKDGIRLRQHSRLSVNFPLTYVVEGDVAPKPGRMRDIGGGGIQFESAESFAQNSALTIAFELPPGLDVELRGRTVLSVPDADDRHRHRVAFVSVPDSVRTAIVDYVYKAFFDELMRS